MVSVFLRGASGHCISPESVPPLEVRILLSKCNFFATKCAVLRSNKQRSALILLKLTRQKKKSQVEGKKVRNSMGLTH